MSRVFIVESPRREVDYSSATEYGNLTFIFCKERQRPSPYNCNEFMQETYKIFEDLKFNPDKDYFCLVGNMLINALTIGVLTREYPKFNLLVYSSVDTKYVLRDISDPSEDGSEPAEPELME